MADRNRDYQQTLDEETAQRPQLQASQHAPEPQETQPDIPGAFHAESLLDNDFFFSGVANTDPSNDNLPQNLKEAFD